MHGFHIASVYSGCGRLTSQAQKEDTSKGCLPFQCVDVVGNGEGNWLNGVEWDPRAESNVMTETGDNIWQITYSDIDASDNYQVKFLAKSANNEDNPWTDNFGADGSHIKTGAVVRRILQRRQH